MSNDALAGLASAQAAVRDTGTVGLDKFPAFSPLFRARACMNLRRFLADRGAAASRAGRGGAAARVELSDTFNEVWTGAQVVVASDEAQVSAWRNCARRRRRREGVEK